MEDTCKKGNHDLYVILRSRHPMGGSESVVRWCRNCGGVVVDTDYDGRTNPGDIMKMKFPKITLNNFK